MADRQIVEAILSHKNTENTSTSAAIHTKYLLNFNRGSQTLERTRKPPCNLVQQIKQEREGIGTGLVLQGGSCEGGKFPREVCCLVGRSVWTERSFKPRRRVQQPVCRKQNWTTARKGGHCSVLPRLCSLVHWRLPFWPYQTAYRRQC